MTDNLLINEIQKVLKFKVKKLKFIDCGVWWCNRVLMECLKEKKVCYGISIQPTFLTVNLGWKVTSNFATVY